MFTARKRSLGQGNVFTPVCHSVHRGGVYIGGSCIREGVCIGEWICIQEGLHSGGVCMQGVGRPPYWMLRDTVNERAVHILLECILVSKKQGR